MSTRRITSGTSLKDYLSSVINESLKAKLQTQALREEENQKMMSSSDSEDEDVTAMKKGDIKSDDVIEKLNTIRSGKSFKDEEISGKMQKYVSGLEQPERVALLAFLKAIAQIVTGEIESQDIVDPSKPPASIEMKKSSGKTVTIKPTIVKAEKKGEKKPSSEDTSGPAPIQPKK
jgi:hypothetical protein